MITYRATLDAPRALAQYLARLLRAERTERGTRRGRRVLGVFDHAVLVLRWFRQSAPVAQLAHDAGIGISPCYRYLHGGIDVLAAEAPDLPDVLRARLALGDTHVILDGMLVDTDRVAGTTRTPRAERWICGTRANTTDSAPTSSSCPVRRVSRWGCPRNYPGAPTTRPPRTGTALSVPCTPAAAHGLPTLADKAYQGAGIGICTPVTKPVDGNVLDADTRCHNMLLTRLRCLGERAAALLTTRWKALGRITLCPSRIGSIVKAALVLTQFEHAGRY